MTHSFGYRDIRFILIIISVIGIALCLYVYLKPHTAKAPTPNLPIPSAGPITVEGRMLCLPHKNTEGPQTLECAFGLQDGEGRYFALQDSDPQYRNVSSAPMGVSVVVVNGEFTPGGSDKYQDVGKILVESIETK